MQLRPATIADIDTLKFWDQQPHLADIGGQDDWYDWDKEIPATSEFNEFLIAELNAQAIGVIQIMDPLNEESHYWGDVAPNLRAIDIWIGEESNLGRGYGTQMMQLALARCFAPPEVTAVLLDPLAGNTAAHRFYERLGFEKIEERIFESELCFVYELTRTRYEARHEA